MDIEEAAVLMVAGLGAGVVNGVAGGGSMVSFPALLALGYPALNANVTSAVGIWPGFLGASAGFRTVLTGQSKALRSLSATAVVGSLAGAGLLLVLPSDSFRAVVPYLLIAACALFAAQPVLVKRLRSAPGDGRRHAAARQVGVFAGALYGGYFGAGLGVLLLAILGLTTPGSLVSLNGVRAVLALVVATASVAAFVVLAPVEWAAAAVMAPAALVGGYLGAHTSRRMPAALLRAVVVALGAAAALRLLLS